MPAGTPVPRHFVLVLLNGAIVIDWGDNLYQDVFSGGFITVKEMEISYTVQNDDLEILKRAGRVDHYDSTQVWFRNLPERPLKLID
jgi:hypothetical protein